MSTSSSSGDGPSRLRGINEAVQLKRHSAFEELEDEEEHEHEHQQHKSNRNGSSAGRWKEESLSGYSAREDERRRKERVNEQLVIQKQADANWMEERKKRLGLEKYRKELGSLSGGFGGGKRDNGTANERVGDEEQKIGLEVRHRLESAIDEDRMQTDNEEQSNTVMESQPVKAEDQDEDTQAREALLSGGNKNAQYENDIIINPITEEEALQRDMDSRPDAPSLSDYANMPVDDFGAALLRGMGWKEGMGAGKQRQGPINAPEVKKRAALLGLGAKERESPVQSGSSNRSSSSRHKPERRYVPVTRKERDEEGGKEESHSRSNKDRKRSYSPPTSSRSSRYEEDREHSRRDRDRYYSDSRRSDRYYDRRRESERRDDRRDRHRSER
ncbi:hypothetical protein L7F22_019091 [Adiantum nelumboides]|nr:hypothetical protein [Adiantum nelumboides]